MYPISPPICLWPVIIVLSVGQPGEHLSIQLSRELVPLLLGVRLHNIIVIIIIIIIIIKAGPGEIQHNRTYFIGVYLDEHFIQIFSNSGYCHILSILWFALWMRRVKLSFFLRNMFTSPAEGLLLLSQATISSFLVMSVPNSMLTVWMLGGMGTNLVLPCTIIINMDIYWMYLENPTLTSFALATTLCS